MGDGLFVHGGVTDAKEARLALAGLLALQGPGALDVRTGVLHGPGTTALVTGTTATAPMQVAIAVHDGVLSRGVANGPYVMPTEAVVLVDIAAAPGSGTRVDVVWERQKDATPGVPTPDGSYGSEYGVLAGTVGAGKPDLAALGPVGATELATVAVSAGAVRTTDGTVLITNTARQTVARGADIPVRNQAERDAYSPFWPLLTVKRLDTGNIEMRNAANNAWVTVYDAGLDSGWTSFNPAWATNGTAQPSIGNGTLVGKYRKLPGRVVETDIYLSFGSTTDSGNGDFRFTLPFPAVAGREHLMLTKAYLAGALWPLMGNALVTASGGSTLIPYVATSPTDGRTFPARNQASGGSAAGTSVPTVPAAYAWVNGSNLTISGRYESTT